VVGATTGIATKSMQDINSIGVSGENPISNALHFSNTNPIKMLKEYKS